MKISDLVELEKSFEHVVFSEKDHSYVINGNKSKSSVTQTIKKYVQPFEKEKLAKITASKQGVTVLDVLELWDFKREYACHKGTMLHSYIETFLQRKKSPLNKDSIENFVTKYADYTTSDAYYKDMARYISNFQNFYDWWKESHILIKSELVVGDAETGICGCMDNLSYDFKNQQIVLFDYKSNKEIKTKGRNKLLGKLNHLEDCELVIYSLQLWIYSLILERNSPFKIQQTPQILWLSGEEYKLYSVLPLEEEAKLILAEAALLG